MLEMDQELEKEGIDTMTIDESGGLEEPGTSSYNHCSLAELITELEKFCTKELVELRRREIEEIRSLFYKKQKAEYASARKNYIQEHGSAEDFVFDSKENEFKDVYTRIKTIRAELHEEKIAIQAQNLKIKKQIIEKLEKLTQTEESLNKTFDEFHALQEEWKKSGPVAPSEDKAIWDAYHFQVGKFYDYVHINKELRDLDLKKNYEQKEALCEAAEKLGEQQLVIKAYGELQNLHEQWREIGPVKEEFKDVLWERFKAASTKINVAYQNYFIARKEQEKSNLEKKTTLCEHVEALNEDLNLTLKQWNAATKKVQEWQKEWRTIGYAPQKDNTKIYERFTSALNTFYAARKTFFNGVHDVEAANRKLKEALCDKAEAMQSRTDWRDATQDFVTIQKEWKKIGPTSYKTSMQLWTRFSNACNAFFAAKSEYERQQNKTLEGNVPRKEELIEKIAALSSETKEDALASIASIQKEWSALQVPQSAKADLQKRFSSAVQKIVNAFHIEGDSNNLAYKIAMEALATEEDGQQKLLSEMKRLKGRYSALTHEIQSLENNIGFIANSTSATKFINTVEKNIEKGRIEILQLEQKIKIITSILQ